MAINKISPCKGTEQWRMPKLRMHLCSVNLLVIAILASLPYISTLSLPTGDPAPGRSPGPPENEGMYTDANESDVTTVSVDYEEPTTNAVTTASDVEASETTVSDACAFARIPSESEGVVTLSDKDSEVNLSVSHAVFETDQLVRGVVYEANGVPMALEFLPELRGITRDEKHADKADETIQKSKSDQRNTTISLDLLKTLQKMLKHKKEEEKLPQPYVPISEDIPNDQYVPREYKKTYFRNGLTLIDSDGNLVN